MAESWHFIGIGGAGMSVLAQALIDHGERVSGSDLSDSAAVAELRSRGALITIGHSAANTELPSADWVVISSAVPASNPELQEAERLRKPVIKRAVLLGRLMEDRRGVAVAGTHGKTTTTAMVALILCDAGRDPAYMIGGVPVDLGAGGYWGAGPELVAEADEYDGSFWQLHPEVALVTNIEAEHLDIYGDLAGVRAAFLRFAGGVSGTVFCCGDDPGASLLAEELAAKSGSPTVSLYGTGADAEWCAADQRPNDRGGSDFTVLHNGERVAQLSLRVPGLHNALNALGAFAVALYLGVAPDVAASSLGRFSGTQRRFQRKGTAHGVLVLDDYAHHPTEIRATLAAARRHMPDSRLIAIFQPHTYSRTRAFLDDFVEALRETDRVLVLPIYASRETDTLGLTGHEIPDLLNEAAPGKALYAATLEEAATWAADLAAPGDTLLTMGAGDVWKAGDQALRLLESRALAR